MFKTPTSSHNSTCQNNVNLCFENLQLCSLERFIPHLEVKENGLYEKCIS